MQPHENTGARGASGAAEAPDGRGPRGRIEAVATRTLAVLRPPSSAFATARGLAVFFGSFSLVSALTLLRGSGAVEDIWWIDLGFLPTALATVLSLVSATLLLAWGLAPTAARWRARATAAAASLLALAACVNVRDFYAAWRSGVIAPAVPVPSSVLVVGGLAWVASCAWSLRVPVSGRANRVATLVVVLALVAAFPLAQVAFFGTTDYRRPSDTAVVLGALVYADGTLSTSLEDRVRTAADLYRAGLVKRLVMSGGVGDTGVDESVAMRDRAVKLGVPASAILLDGAGVNTDATVRDTMRMPEVGGAGRVLVVSQFYHLPRIKLAYRAAGRDVQTVPATASLPILQTPALVLREVPGFWTYWVRAVLRDIRGG